MGDEFSLKDWNWAVVMLSQAMVGVVSCNFVCVYLYHTHDKWIVRVILKKDDPQDREEIEDLADYFAVYLDEARFVDDVDYRVSDAACMGAEPEIIISRASALSNAPPEPYRVLFSMRPATELDQ